MSLTKANDATVTKEEEGKEKRTSVDVYMSARGSCMTLRLTPTYIRECTGSGCMAGFFYETTLRL